LKWRRGGPECSGRFDVSSEACFMAPVKAEPVSFKQTPERKQLKGINKVVETAVFDSYTFGLQWNNSKISSNGHFPRYYMDTDTGRVAVPESKVPARLREMEFKPAKTGENYSWGNPGPAKGPFYANLADGSRVTYYWYRFIDQPSLQQYKEIWSNSQKAEIQSIVEKIQKSWNADKEYMPAPRDGKPLVSIDRGLLVTPPEGLESGYVPIVTRQEIAK
jgi:hypothetical protein